MVCLCCEGSSRGPATESVEQDGEDGTRAYFWLGEKSVIEIGFQISLDFLIARYVCVASDFTLTAGKELMPTIQYINLNNNLSLLTITICKKIPRKRKSLPFHSQIKKVFSHWQPLSAVNYLPFLRYKLTAQLKWFIIRWRLGCLVKSA